MPLLLRRSAPSPSIDQLAFSVPTVPPRSTSTASTSSSSTTTTNSHSNNNTLLRASTGSETQHYAQLQRCSTHARMSMARRQSTASSIHTELVCTVESCETADCSDPQHLTALVLREGSSSSGDDDSDQSAARASSARTASKKSTEQPDDDDTATSDYGFGSDAGRASSAPSCTCSYRDDDACNTASNVTIEDTQLAVVDRELRDLRKTFADKLYKRLSKMSVTFGRRRGTSTPQLTAS